MEAPIRIEPEPSAPALHRAYDPNNLHPADAAARKEDDLSEGIDWDEIIATTQDDWEAGRYKEFNLADFPTEDALVAALIKSWNLDFTDERR